MEVRILVNVSIFPVPVNAWNYLQNGLDLIPGIGDPGDRLYLGSVAAEIAPPPNEAPLKKSKT